jgi:hypothetical protein
MTHDYPSRDGEVRMRARDGGTFAIIVVRSMRRTVLPPSIPGNSSGVSGVLIPTQRALLSSEMASRLAGWVVSVFDAQGS